MPIDIIEGDSREVLTEFADNSIDSCVTDPPYALVSISKRFGAEGAAPAQYGKDGVYARASAGFMGKTWDTGKTAFDPAFWAEVLRVLKPGAHLLAFGGTRTYHRLACAIEDAGFEIRDQIGWVYGSGFPKSHNQHGEWEGWGTALKPAWEPIVVARKPLDGTVAANLAAHGVGVLNIDDCRVAMADGETVSTGFANSKAAGVNDVHDGWKRPWRKDGEYHAGKINAAVDRTNTLGRWPANIIHDGSDEVLGAFPVTKSGKPGVMRLGKNTGASFGAESHAPGTPMTGFGDEGSAARFFYCAKASRKDRGEGNSHPTVKPTELMRYLCKLVTPPGGTVLDPFMGSGSTGVAAQDEGFSFTGIEADASYFDIACKRLGLDDAMQAAE